MDKLTRQLTEALRDCEARLTLLIDAGRGKLLDVLARDAARDALAGAESERLPAVGSERPLSDPYLNALRFALVTSTEGLRSITEDLTPGELSNAGTPMADEVTGAVVDAPDGEYREVWLSYSSRPYALAALYTRVR